MTLWKANVPFEDVRLDWKTEWPAFKAGNNPEFGQVPLLHLEDGTVLSQTKAILNFIGKKYGLMPDDPMLVY